MPIQVQASDVFNRDAWIDPGGKQLWTFYGMDGRYRNHYGILKVMGYDDKPTEVFRPLLANYKGKVYPVNRIHSTWPGIETSGKPGLMQPRPPDIHKMWKTHFDDPAQHPELANIKDDDGDGALEINRPEEVDALIVAVTKHLVSLNYDLKGKRVVWVSSDRAYHSGTEYRAMDKAEWEASPYAKVHKYNHDIAPARAGLGSGGCTDCHSSKSEFFDRAVLLTALSPEDGGWRWTPNSTVLGYSSASVRLGAFREETLKPILYAMLALLVGLIVILGLRGVAVHHGALSSQAAAGWSWLALAALVIGGLIVARSPDLAEHMTARRFTLDAAHFWVGAGVLLVGLVLALQRPVRGSGAGTPTVLGKALWMLLALTGLCGLLVLLKLGWLAALTRWAYSGFDLCVVLLVLVFGIALGPCTFAYMAPMLAVTFKLAQTAPVYGASLLLAYGIGHCSVIVLAGTFTEMVRCFLNWNENSKGVTVMKRICGALVILGGLWLVYSAA